MYNYLAAFFGVVVGALAAPMILGRAIDNPPLAAAIGAAAGGVIGFTIPELLKKAGVIKAQ